ncbi:MAG TPA: hypothetical protein VGM84_05100 [Steroidobacteraceae bacterium]|jgi:hypothetical protein
MYALSLIAHFRMMSAAAQSIGTRAQLSFETMRVQVSDAGRYFEFEPEFLGVRAGRICLSPTVEPQTVAFTGWRHGPRRRWELATDKRVFKEFCARNGLRTPATFAAPSDAPVNVLVKEVRVPRERGVLSGPLPLRALSTDTFANQTVLVEQFIPGDIALGLYCEGELYAVEIRKMPRVTGDGRNDLRDLIARVRQPVGELDWAVVENVARMQGLTLETVLASGAEALVDVGFRSVLQPFTTMDQNVIGRIAGTSLHRQLQQAGPILWQGIPEEIRANAHFQVYAVVDARDTTWFVDMDTDLHIDPHGYRPTLRRLFGIRAPAPQEIHPTEH